jgi:Hen1-like subunit of RNA repair complex
VGVPSLSARHLVDLTPVLLTITTTQRPATDLARLLHQDPDRVRLVTLPFGSSLVCFSQASDARCTAAVMVHSERRSPSLLALGLAEVFDPALAERRDDGGHRGMPLPIVVDVPLLPCGAGADRPRRLFEPLGYHVGVAVVPADPRRVAAGDDPARRGGVPDVALRLTGLVRVPELLAHLCVLLPVLEGDDDRGVRHDRDGREVAVEPLLGHGGRWLSQHPERAAVVRRFGAASRAVEGV